MIIDEFTHYNSLINNPVYKKLNRKHSGYKHGKKDFKHMIEDEMTDLSLENGIKKALKYCWVVTYCKCKRKYCYGDGCVKAVNLLDTCDEDYLTWLNFGPDEYIDHYPYYLEEYDSSNE